MDLTHLKHTYEVFGREDPFFAVLSAKERRHNRWDPEAFFRTGQDEIGTVLEYLAKLRMPFGRSRALDFGCGVGRLSQALARHFDQVVGVDISSSMVDNARQWNSHGSRVEYLVNDRDDLQSLADNSFDFMYSNITLQHIPPQASCRYIQEFVRVLRPDGIGVFQVPNGAPLAPRSFWGRFYRIHRGYLRPLWKRLRGLRPVEIHYVPRVTVEHLIRDAGGRMVDVVDVSKRRNGGNLRYVFVKEPAAA